MYNVHHEVEADLARQTQYEEWNCVVLGQQELRMVSPAYKNNMYSGTTESLQPQMSPVDLFHEDELAQHETFPLTK